MNEIKPENDEEVKIKTKRDEAADEIR